MWNTEPIRTTWYLHTPDTSADQDASFDDCHVQAIFEVLAKICTLWTERMGDDQQSHALVQRDAALIMHLTAIYPDHIMHRFSRVRKWAQATMNDNRPHNTADTARGFSAAINAERSGYM